MMTHTEDEFSAPEGAPPDGPSFHELKSIVFAGQTADVGLDGLFNTFRMGSRWSVLKPGDPLMLMVDDPRADSVVYKELDRLGTVLRVETGTLADMLLLHLGLNHADFCDNRRFHPFEQRVMMKTLLEVCYGEEFDGSEDCVVIYIHREPASIT
jgi:hypothetical protein